MEGDNKMYDDTKKGYIWVCLSFWSGLLALLARSFANKAHFNAANNISDTSGIPALPMAAISPGAELFFFPTLGSSLTPQLTQSLQTRQTPLSAKESTAYRASARFPETKENNTIDKLNGKRHK